MNKERLEWIMSGLNRYKLTGKEDQLVNSALEDFNQKHTLTAQQEEKLESLYKVRSKLIPDKSYFSPKQNTPGKTRVQKSRAKVVF